MGLRTHCSFLPQTCYFCSDLPSRSKTTCGPAAASAVTSESLQLAPRAGWLSAFPYRSLPPGSVLRALGYQPAAQRRPHPRPSRTGSHPRGTRRGTSQRPGPTPPATCLPPRPHPVSQRASRRLLTRLTAVSLLLTPPEPSTSLQTTCCGLPSGSRAEACPGPQRAPHISGVPPQPFLPQVVPAAGLTAFPERGLRGSRQIADPAPTAPRGRWPTVGVSTNQRGDHGKRLLCECRLCREKENNKQIKTDKN